MKRNGNKLARRLTTLALVGIISASSLTACGDKDSEQSDGKVLVGVSTVFPDTAFLNDDGELDGFEIDLLKIIDERLDDYEFELQQSQFDNILLSLDSKKIDMGSHMFEYSEERAQKYLYGKEGYKDYSVHLITMKGNGYTSLESLAGKTIGAISDTDNPVLQIEKYNQQNPDKAVKFDYYGEGTGTDVIVKTLEEGRWEAITDTQSGFEQKTKEYGDKFELGDLITESDAYFLFPDDDEHEALRDAVDEVIKELKEDGTLNELSEKWYGTPAYYDEE